MPSQDDYTAIAIGLGALVLLSKWTFPKIPLDKLNILPETEEFGEGLFNIKPRTVRTRSNWFTKPTPSELVGVTRRGRSTTYTDNRCASPWTWRFFCCSHSANH